MPTTSSRLLSLLSLLQTRRDWPATTLAERLDVTDRTVRRDVDRLRELGYPITSTRGREGGYRLDAGASLPPLLFDDEQAVALAVALQTAAASGAGIEEGATRALRTVRQLLPVRLRHRVDALHVHAGPPGHGDPVDPAVLSAISAAIGAREVLRLDHRAPGEPADAAPGPPRRVEPHHLVARAGRWYLVAWDLDRDDWRTFRVDRLTPRSPGGARFTPREVPGGDLDRYLTSRFRGLPEPGAAVGRRGGGVGDGGGAGGAAAGDEATGSARAEWPCRGEVVVHAPAAEVAPYVADGVVQDLGSGRCRVVLGAWSWVGLAASLARFDADVDVVGPPALAEAFGRLAERFARTAGGAAR
ncbi:YafY family protein [Cellulomonas cellasea]|uniref:Putative DNA-binding transcriptional regulator YafY n=1 Tax=Cellulomonas cellasea TaxID=43670 RepID=A0A7W4UHN5_9CELL|nr:WYL domain-containing protein [Cellulomonas cellasea]MBB2924332.1 putative DNA-binding transcriptional regulator YafY [Cellulomonas cellasea]